MNEKDRNGCTALHCVKDAECAKALLTAEALFNEKDTRGCTPLYLAVKDGHLGTVQALIAAGAKVNENANNVWTMCRSIAEMPRHHVLVNMQK